MSDGVACETEWWCGDWAHLECRPARTHCLQALYGRPTPRSNNVGVDFPVRAASPPDRNHSWTIPGEWHAAGPLGLILLADIHREWHGTADGL